MNTDDLWPDHDVAWWQVLKIQTKLHQWSIDDPHRRFDDLYNLVYDPAVLAEAWHRVKGNRGARSAGVDGQTAHYISIVRGEEEFLTELRADLKARTFVPQPVRERMIPKSGGKQRRLGIATVRDRVAQAADWRVGLRGSLATLLICRDISVNLRPYDEGRSHWSSLF